MNPDPWWLPWLGAYMGAILGAAIAWIVAASVLVARQVDRYAHGPDLKR